MYSLFSIAHHGSNEINATTLAAGAPAAVTLAEPEIPTGSEGGELELSWTESGAQDFASYKVYRSTQPVVCARDTLGFAGVQVSGVTCQDTGVSPDTTYYYRVVTTDEGGQSAPSNEKSAYTPATSAEAPTGAATAASRWAGAHAGRGLGGESERVGRAWTTAVRKATKHEPDESP